MTYVADFSTYHSVGTPKGMTYKKVLCSQPLEHGLSTFDYEGEVRPNPKTTVGRFGMSRLQVRVRRFSLRLIYRLASRADMILFAGFHHDGSLPAKSIYVTT